ncbi:MAG TPA: R3H domain-containing nucleic acid-binding protein [Candidatus Nitrosocosmicus sp.]|nr:R3H domain-containing nucleic acid-binding protein [Candidatus Nitrosocosmicus sp.]
MNKEEIIKTQVEELLNKLTVTASVDVTQEDDRYVVQLNTDTDAPFLIGRYGETLISFQRVLEAMLYKKSDEEVHLLINVNDYREKQKERLESIADNLAHRVQEQGREAYLRSFSAYERKIIHEYIGKNYPNLHSRSEDDGTSRKLVISLKDASEELTSQE